MTRTLKTLMTLCLGALLFTSVACENKETEEALKTCKNDLSNELKKGAAQQAALNEAKSQLAVAQAKVAELTKVAEAPKNGKAEEKGKAGETKKSDEVAKAEKKGKKK